MSESAKMYSFKDLMRAQSERKEPSVEDVSSPISLVEADKLQLTENKSGLVNQSDEIWLTKNESLVNKLTKNESLVNQITKKVPNLVNKLTKDENLVNQTLDDRLTKKELRARSSEVVEGFRTSLDFKRRVKEFCGKHGIDKQDFYVLAVNQYFDLLVNQKDANLVNWLTIDDRRLILWRTTPPIINLYCKFNSTKKWTVKDDLAAQKFNNEDIRIVELGILQTLGNKNFNVKVNSFAYFVPEIEVWIGNHLPSESVDVILEMNRRKWEAFNAKK